MNSNKIHDEKSNEAPDMSKILSEFILHIMLWSNINPGPAVHI